MATLLIYLSRFDTLLTSSPAVTTAVLSPSCIYCFRPKVPSPDTSERMSISQLNSGPSKLISNVCKVRENQMMDYLSYQADIDVIHVVCDKHGFSTNGHTRRN